MPPHTIRVLCSFIQPGQDYPLARLKVWDSKSTTHLMFWVVIHVAVEYCWTMLNPYPRNPRISNKWNNYTFKCQVFFLHYMQVSLATASVHSIQSHRWCVLFMTTGGLLASSFADAYTDDAGVRWPTFGILGEVTVGDETITPRDVSGCKFGTFF